jgi:NAD(P)-dependent dehydrogenase (short-subunit alcohol dehydrogenase family)
MQGASSVAIVTGANRGLGLAFVDRLSSRGVSVVAACRDPSAAVDLVRMAETRDVHVVRCDVMAEGAGDVLAEAVSGRSVDLLLHNAGIFGGAERSLLDVDPAGLRAALETNAVAPLLLTRALWEDLAPGAKVVCISSLMGSIADNGSGGRHAYRMSKAAMNMLVQCLAHDGASRGIVAAALHPGWVRTGMGGASAPLSIDESVDAMMRTLDALDADRSGGFFDRFGDRLQW